jgi:hypothetical protein
MTQAVVQDACALPAFFNNTQNSSNRCTLQHVLLPLRGPLPRLLLCCCGRNIDWNVQQ